MRCPIRCALAFAAVFLGLASCSSQQPGTPTTTRPAIAPVVTSKQIPNLHRQWLNLAYANHSEAEKLDLYLPVHRPAHSGLPGTELDLNPILVSPAGALAVDCKVRLAPRQPGPGPLFPALRRRPPILRSQTRSGSPAS